MYDSNATEIERGIGNEVDHFVVRAPKRNHDAMVQLGNQFADVLRKIWWSKLIILPGK
jgi:hypothetical protein